MPRLRSRAPIAHSAARARALTVEAAHRAARARIDLAIVIPLIAGVLLANEYRRQIFGLDMPVRILTARQTSTNGHHLSAEAPIARPAIVADPPRVPPNERRG